MDMDMDPQEEYRGLVSRVGPIEVDWPRSIGYFGGITAATALGFIEPPVAIFIVAIPFFQLLIRPNAPTPVRFIGQVLQGAGTPLGAGGKAVIEPIPPEEGPSSAPPPRQLSILAQARQLANRAEGKSH
ncbi:MAG TPA: hypothetical protein VKV40_00080 [Ktedonobacteraceae bacterium]|nr:hypothetical protein [Ktedonobacteraceae bacterium]